MSLSGGDGFVTSSTLLKGRCDDNKNCIDVDGEAMQTLLERIKEPKLLQADHRLWRGDVNGDGFDDVISRSDKGDRYFLIVGGSSSVKILINDEQATKAKEWIAWSDQGDAGIRYKNPQSEKATDKYFDVGDLVNFKQEDAPSTRLNGFNIFFDPRTDKVAVHGEVFNETLFPLDQLAISPLTESGQPFRVEYLWNVIGKYFTHEVDDIEIPDDLSSAEDKAVMLLSGAQNLMAPFIEDVATIRGTAQVLADIQNIKIGEDKVLEVRGEVETRVSQAMLSIDKKLDKLFERYQLTSEQADWLRQEFAARHLHMAFGSYLYYVNLATNPESYL